MRYYCLERPRHCPMEDAYFAAAFSDNTGKEWGLFLVADGLSGSNGTFASTLATKYLGAKILEEMKSGRTTDYPALLRETIASANEQLRLPSIQNLPMAKTTLDAVLVSSDRDLLYVGHLGDGRVYLGYADELKQITVDEGGGHSGPRNYLGLAYLAGDPRPIENRVNIIEPYKKDLIKPKYILLASDGLTSRVPPETIKSICGRLNTYTDPSELLEELRKEVELPRSMLLSYPNTDEIRRIFLYKIPDVNINEHCSKEELVDCILQIYQGGSNPKLRERIDLVLKDDDTTIILVDLEDMVTRRMHLLNTQENCELPELLAGIDAYKRIAEKQDLELARQQLLALTVVRAERKRWERRFKEEGDYAQQLYEQIQKDEQRIEKAITEKVAPEQPVKLDTLNKPQGVTFVEWINKEKTRLIDIPASVKSYSINTYSFVVSRILKPKKQK